MFFFKHHDLTVFLWLLSPNSLFFKKEFRMQNAKPLKRNERMEIMEEAIRTENVTFLNDITEEDFDIPQISIVSVENRTVRFKVTGSMDDVIKHLSHFEIKDLVSRGVSVEDIFMHYYGD